MHPIILIFKQQRGREMKYVLLGLLLNFNVFASMDCYTDSLGNTHCTSSDGGSTDCYTDSLGNTHCN